MIYVIQMLILKLVGILYILAACFADKYTKKWNLHGKSGEGYYLATLIGTPSQNFNLLLDTGSSNLAIAGFSSPGLDSYYKAEDSNSSISYIEKSINVSYFQGSWKGHLARDVFSIPDINAKPIFTDVAVIKTADGFYVNNSHWQGILGLAYKSIAKPNGMVMPWFDSLIQLYPEKSTFSLELCGADFTSKIENHHGNFSIGEDKKCSSSNYTTAIIHEGFYEVLISELHIGHEKLDVSCVDLNSPRTIIDSGTTNLQLPMNIYTSVIEKIKVETDENGLTFSADFWYNGGVICLMLSLKDWLKFPWITIYFNVNDDLQFGSNIPPNSYLRPSLGGSNDTHACVYLGIEQSHVGTVLGVVALEGFCLHFDRANKRIHFSKSTCGPNVNILELYNPDLPDCFYVPSEVNGPLIASIIILILITLPLLITVIKWGYMHVIHRRRENSVPFISLSDGIT